MSLKDLLQSGANLSLTVSLEDLRQLVKEIIGNNSVTPNEPPAEKFLSRKEILHLLGIDSSTLWSWEKTGYIKSYPFGGRKRYKADDAEAIRTGRKGGRYGK